MAQKSVCSKIQSNGPGAASRRKSPRMYWADNPAAAVFSRARRTALGAMSQPVAAKPAVAQTRDIVARAAAGRQHGAARQARMGGQKIHQSGRGRAFFPRHVVRLIARFPVGFSMFTPASCAVGQFHQPRGARAAIRASCVAMISVACRSSRNAQSKWMISSPVCESRLPVGSSARIKSGWLISARAMATRCCSPPDNS